MHSYESDPLTLTQAAFHRLTQQYDVPDFVKQASAEALQGTAQVNDRLYALSKERLLPWHTAAATWASTILFEENRPSFTPKEAADVEDVLRKAAHYHGVANACSQVKQAVHKDLSPRDDDLPDSSFGLVIEWQDGDKHRLKERIYPLTSAEEVKLASEQLPKHYDRFLYEDRRTLARTILAKAEEMGAEVVDRDYLEKQAGHGFTSAAMACRLLDSRRRFLISVDKEAKMQAGLADLAARLQADTKLARAPGVLRQIAQLVDAVDKNHPDALRQSGLTVEEALFSVPTKAAEAVRRDLVSLPEGTTFRQSDLARIRPDELAAAFGEEAALGCFEGTRVSGAKVAAFARQLTPPGERLFAAVAGRSGIQPVTSLAG